MIDTACPSCGANARQWKRTNTVEVPMPFWARIELLEAQCPCGAQLRAAVPNYAPAEPQVWTRRDEILRRGVDYIAHVRGERVNRGLHPHVFWAWTPMPGSDFEKRVIEASMVRSLVTRDRWRILVVPDNYSYRIPRQHVDEVWLLRDRVMRDRLGPYPSVRAERSLMRTLSPAEITHFWPAATLPVRWYRELQTWQELARTWALYTRRNIPVSIGAKHDRPQ